MANVNVTYQEMTSAATKLAQGEQEINDRLGALQREIDALVQSGYVTDKSSRSFEESYTRFTKGAQDVIKGLDGMGNYLTAAAHTFEDADQQLAAALSR